MTSWRDRETLQQEPERTNIDRKSAPLGETLRCQFRQLMRQLTARLAPKPNLRKKRREEARGGFVRAALVFTRRATGWTHFPPAIWDVLSWLRHWEFDDSAAIAEYYSDAGRPDSASEPYDLSLRL
jgi:hypothetical protein